MCVSKVLPWLLAPNVKYKKLSWKEKSQEVAHFSRGCLIQDGNSLGFVVVFLHGLLKNRDFKKTASTNFIDQGRWCLPSEAVSGHIIKQWVLKYQVWGKRTTEANNGTWAWNGKTLNELFESHNVARRHFCFNYPSVWLFLLFQTWNEWEPESEISVVSIHESSANAFQVLSMCSV